MAEGVIPFTAFACWPSLRAGAPPTRFPPVMDAHPTGAATKQVNPTMTTFGRLSRKIVCTAAAAVAALVLAAGGASAAARISEPRSDESAKIEIVIDKSKQQMIVYVGGEKRHEWKVSTGAAGHDTPVGTFKPMSMHPMAYAPKYGNTPMPQPIF